MSSSANPADQRLQSVEATVKELTTNVQELVDAVREVGALKEAQQEQTVRQDASDERASTARDQSFRRYRRTSLWQQLTVLVILIAVPLASLFAYWTLTSQVNAQFQQQQNDLIRTCELRNQANVTIPQQREQALARVYLQSGDRIVADIHQQSADALGRSAVDCSLYKRPGN